MLNRAPFEFDEHVPHARAAGSSRREDGGRPALAPASARDGASCAEAAHRFSADERLVLELADAMTRDIEVPDEMMARLNDALRRAAALLELVATVAAYNMVSRLLVALACRALRLPARGRCCS